MEYIYNGNQIFPAIGLGTYDVKYNDFLKLLPVCLEYGITFFDSAEKYENETDLGKALKVLNIRREDIIIATKISNKQQNSCSTIAAIEDSLMKLNTDYIDYYFIHSPKYKYYKKTWCEMIQAKNNGLIKNIAVSNFSEEQIEMLFAETGVYPTILQTLVNPLNFPNELIRYCNEKNIVVQSYCPLNRMNKDITSNYIVSDLAIKYNKTIAQILLRFLYQCNILSIPKTTSLFHLNENVNIFDFKIEEKDIRLLIGE